MRFRSILSLFVICAFTVGASISLAQIPAEQLKEPQILQVPQTMELPEEQDEIEKHPAVSEQTLMKATSMPSRQEAITALSSAVGTRRTLHTMIGGTGLGIKDIGTTSLSGNKLDLETTDLTPGLPSIPELPEAPPSYEEIDWESGVEFTPRSTRRAMVDDKNVKLGGLMTEGLRTTAGLGVKDFYERDFLLLRPNSSSIHLYADVPTRRGWMVTVNLTPTDSEALSGWTDHLFISVGAGPGEPENHGYENITEFTRLEDDSGIAFLVPFELGPYTTPESTLRQMEMRRWTLRINIYPEHPLTVAHSFIFGGIKLTKL